MFDIFRKGMMILAGITVLLAGGCGDSDKKQQQQAQSQLSSDAGILKYIPADTPYLMGLLEPLPDDVLDKFEPNIEAVLEAYRDMIVAAVNESQNADDADDGKPDMDAKTVAMLEELQSIMSLDGINSVGITRKSLFAIYGNGLLPVARLTLSDGKLMESAIARLEEKSGEKLATAKIGGHSYRYAGDDKARIIFAVLGDELVFGLVPNSVSDDILKSTLGLDLPDSNIADSGRLTKLAKDYGYLSQYISLLDIQALAEIFIGDTGAVNQELLATLDVDNSNLSDDCKTEIRGMAAVVPRLHAGYTRIDTEQMDAAFIAEIRSDLAAPLMKFVAPVPGLGTDPGGIMSFGMSFNLLAMREFYAAQLDALEADPYKCELFADLNNDLDKARAVLQQPVPPMVYNFKGMSMVIEGLVGLDMSNPKKPVPPTSVDGRVLLAIDNAPSLLAMASAFQPQLADLDIKPDGKPVQLDAMGLPNVGGTVYAAMTENSLALSIGDGMQDKLGAMLNADPGSPAPALSLNYDGERYLQFIGDAIGAGDADDDNPQSKEMLAAVKKLLAASEKMQGRISMNVLMTERGIEIPVSTELN